MTDTQLTWIGIVSQAIPTITAILMVTVSNWMIKRNQRRNKLKKQRELCLHNENLGISIDIMPLSGDGYLMTESQKKEFITNYIKANHDRNMD